MAINQLHHERGHDHWGTPECPGPTLRIVPDIGSQCCGVAFEFKADAGERALAKLREREGKWFFEKTLPIKLADNTDTEASTFIYTGKNVIDASDDTIAQVMVGTKGTDGSPAQYLVDCREYLESVQHKDPVVERLWDAMKRVGLPRV